MFDAKGEQYQVPGFVEKFRAEMDDLTQKSSLSPTQANSESVYEQFDLQKSIREQCISNSAEEVAYVQIWHAQNNRRESISKQHQSVVTDSTTYTYGEDDTGHVHLDFITEPESHDMEENISQDASFAPRVHNLSQGYPFEPQTPAPPVNPFSQKGSVMKGHEMFGATQPSSIGKRLTSPTSSRPSPDVYDDSSPGKQMVSSPLVGRGDNISPLQRTMLLPMSIDSPSRADVFEPSGSRSLYSRRVNSREPRDVYISMEESQERRREAARDSSADSDSNGSDSDIEAISNKRQRERERNAKIQKQLAKVTSSKPDSRSSGVVEVPSTGRRRRSEQEEYITQCEGTYGRDTQQDDVIIDSQALVEEPEALRTGNAAGAGTSDAEPVGSPESNEVASPKLPACTAHNTETDRVPDLYPNSPMEEASTASEDLGSLLKQPILPLQEASTNSHDLGTPVASKNQVSSDEADTSIPNTILETSPLGEDRIRPIGEIASTSFIDNMHDGGIDDAPGFTQDVEFENAIRPRLSPSPPSRRSRDVRDKGFPLFQGATGAAETPRMRSQSPVSKLHKLEGSDDAITAAAAKANDQCSDVSSENDTSKGPRSKPRTKLKRPIVAKEKLMEHRSIGKEPSR